MEKVIAVNDGKQLLTTEAIASKNNWWITYWVDVVPAETETSIPEKNNEKVPETGGLMKAIGGVIYRFVEVRPAHICFLCHEKGASRVGNLFYCTAHFKRLVVTHPIRRTGKKPQRNAPCTCKSGKKYKNCCGTEMHRPRHYFNSEYKHEKNA